jgi:hypothetical protein
MASVEAPCEIPFGFAQGRLSLRLKNGSGQDDSSTRRDMLTPLTLLDFGLRGAFRDRFIEELPHFTGRLLG